VAKVARAAIRDADARRAGYARKADLLRELAERAEGEQ
jgi:hypothetical protein